MTKVEYISVHIDPVTLEVPVVCLLCGADMDETLLEFIFQDKPVVVKSRESVPGYRCRSCEAEYYNGSVTLALYKETLTKLGSTSKLKGPLEQRIASLTEALA